MKNATATVTVQEIKTKIFEYDEAISLGNITLAEIQRDLDWYFDEPQNGDKLELAAAYKNGTSVPRLQGVAKTNDTYEIISGWEAFGFEDGLNELIEYAISRNQL